MGENQLFHKSYQLFMNKFAFDHLSVFTFVCFDFCFYMQSIEAKVVCHC